MDVLKFNLSGKTAFFKIEEVNTYYCNTFGNIHKVALLGIFGAILGYGGYSQMKKNDDYPEFYKRLKDINLSIIPIHKQGLADRKIQSFNNSVGYASAEQGGNLIVKENWLENPSWDIYVKLDNEESQKLAQKLLDHSCVFIPYLGKNDHPADIKHVEVINAKHVAKDSITIDCLYPKEIFSIQVEQDDFFAEYEFFKYEEHLPLLMDSEANRYIQKPFVFTNMELCNKKADIFNCNDKNIVFY